MSPFPSGAVIREVGLRDGLQSIATILPTGRKLEWLEDPHLKASGGLVPMQTDDGDTTDVVLLPLLMGGRRPGVRAPLPRVGEHTDEVLARLSKKSAA